MEHSEIAEATEFFNRAFLNARVHEELDLYRITQDGRFFWRAFLRLHGSGQPVRQDFLDKLAEIGKKLLSADSADSVVSALEFSGNKKKHVGPETSAAYRRRYVVATKVHWAKTFWNVSLKQAIEIIAKDRNLSVSKVKADYHKIYTAPAKAEKKGTRHRDIAQAMNAWR